MKKSTSAVVGLLFCLSLISCGKNTLGKIRNKNQFEPRLDTQKEANINVLGIYGNFEALEQVFLDFNEYYPNVNLCYEYTDNNVDATLNRCIARDNIDIVFTFSMEFDYFYKTLMENYLVDLEKCDIDFSNVNKNAMEATLANGMHQFVPMYYQTTGLLVNESLLKEYGVSIPTNLFELEKACDTFLENGITPVYATHSASGRFFYGHAIQDILNRSDSEDVIASLNSGDGKYEVFHSTMDIYNRWLYRGYFDFSANELPDQYNAILMKFLEGKIPFVACTSDSIGGCKKREAKSEAYCANSFEYTYIPSPTGVDGFECTYMPSLLFGLCNVSDSIDYATEFMRFLFSKQEMQVMESVKGTLATNEDSKNPKIRYFMQLKDSEKNYAGTGNLSRRASSQIYSVLGKAYKLHSVRGALGLEYEKAMSEYAD